MAAAAVFVMLLVAVKVTVSWVSADWARPVRMVGPGVRTWSGYVLMAVGIWFLLLVVLPSPLLF